MSRLLPPLTSSRRTNPKSNVHFMQEERMTLSERHPAWLGRWLGSSRLFV